MNLLLEVKSKAETKEHSWKKYFMNSSHWMDNTINKLCVDAKFEKQLLMKLQIFVNQLINS